MRKRRCKVCLGVLYNDEPGRMCQDCEGVCRNMHAAHFGAGGIRRSRDHPGHAERMAAHCERVQRELALLPACDDVTVA